MDEGERLQLQKMIKANDVEDQTGLIRELKHSELLRNDVNNFILLKSKYKDDHDSLVMESMNECNFLFTYYTDIYNKIKKDEIDLSILFSFLDVLKKIEKGEVDQHEGSFIVGKLLKELYVDSALKKADKLNEENEKNAEKFVPVEPLSVSWKEYKGLMKKQA